ncbi:unnamed protein product [Protopolystoma xenopodis]|uniref:Uncharacterized protein n=1 Tax=Protopolystoma xenopodis TaxID=117903 RepID=A0A448WZL8_9PLAT|nr:unnamed protein product [Protopolystoma xenopodis]
MHIICLALGCPDRIRFEYDFVPTCLAYQHQAPPRLYRHCLNVPSTSSIHARPFGDISPALYSCASILPSSADTHDLRNHFVRPSLTTQHSLPSSAASVIGASVNLSSSYSTINSSSSLNTVYSSAITCDESCNKCSRLSLDPDGEGN